jgi:ankyrin repeat protein
MPHHIARALMLAGAVFAATACTGGAGSVDAREVYRDPTAAALAKAAAEGDKPRVRELIRNGGNPNARGDQGVSLLQWALLNRSVPGMEALLEGGADPATADSSGKTALHYAALANDPAYLETLLRAGADPNTPNAVTREPPIVPALMGQREEQFRALLAAGADPNLADRMGDTPLHVAAKINAFARVLDLLKAGADPAAVNIRGTTFRTYLERTPENLLSEEGRKGRNAIYAWLEAHERGTNR